MPQIIQPTTVPADGSYVSLALNSLYQTGYLLLTGPVDMIMQYAPMTGQQQDMFFANLPGGQYSLSPGTKNLITGFKIRAPGGATGSTVQYSLAIFEPTIPSIIPAGGGASGPFRASTLQPKVSSYHANNQPVPDDPGHEWSIEWVWDGPFPGWSDLFDLTNPASPAAREDGLYAITITAIPQTNPAGKFWNLTMDTNSSFGPGIEGFAATTWPFGVIWGSAGTGSPWGSISFAPWPLLAGETFDGIIAQNAGAGTILFNALAYVMFLSADLSLDH